MLISTRYELTKLINEKGYKTGVEVGVREGFFSYYLLKHSKLKHLYSIDPFGGRHGDQDYKNASSMLAHFGKKSDIIRKTSMEVAEQFAREGKKFDYVYIDANHRYRFVKDDIAAWWNLIEPGGMLSGHDYVVAKNCGVIAAVDEFVARENLKLELTTEHLASWYVYKP